MGIQFIYGHDFSKFRVNLINFNYPWSPLKIIFFFELTNLNLSQNLQNCVIYNGLYKYQ